MPHRSPERALIDAAARYAAAIAGASLVRVCVTLSDGGKRRIDPPLSVGPPAVEIEGTPADPAESLAAKLLRCLLSPDGLQIMRVIADRGQVEAKAIVMALTNVVDRSKCYTLLTELRERGLIRDDGSGYTLADAEVWGAVHSP